MTELPSLENLANLGVLLLLRAVLGFGNLLYIQSGYAKKLALENSNG